MEVGDLITLYRKQAGLTIDELADKSGVSKGTDKRISSDGKTFSLTCFIFFCDTLTGYTVPLIITEKSIISTYSLQS